MIEIPIQHPTNQQHSAVSHWSIRNAIHHVNIEIALSSHLPFFIMLFSCVHGPVRKKVLRNNAPASGGFR